MTTEEFTLFAAKMYDLRHSTSIDDFYEDLKRFQYVKRLLRKYKDGGELKSRLITNHLIVIFNCFGEGATILLFDRMKGYESQLKPFLEMLSFLPEKFINSDGDLIYTRNIVTDTVISKELRKL